MSHKLKIVTIGGGSSYTPELLEGFIKRYHELPITELWLVDVEEGKEKLDIIFELCQRMVKKAGIPLTIYKTLNRREALKDADFIYVKNWSSFDDYAAMPEVKESWMLTNEKLGNTNQAKVMHCLPVRRNVELSDEVMDGGNSIIYQQAKNRIFSAQAVFSEILDELNS